MKNERRISIDSKPTQKSIYVVYELIAHEGCSEPKLVFDNERDAQLAISNTHDFRYKEIILNKFNK